MKKIIALLVTTILAMSMLTGCGEKDFKNLDVSKYVTLCDYKSIETSFTMPEISEEELTMNAEGFWEFMLTEETGIKDRAVEEGDTVYISFIGYKDEVAFEGGTGESFLKIGSGRFIPGFEDGLVGVMPGETVNLDLTFPEDYGSADLAGAAVVFEVTLHYIGAPMTDENVASVTAGQYADVASFKESVKEQMMEAAKYEIETQMQNEIIQKLVLESTFEKLPEWLVEENRLAVEEGIQNIVQAQSPDEIETIDADAYCQQIYGQSIQEVAEQSVKQKFVLQAIADEEGLNVDDEELNASLEKMAEEFNLGSVEELVGDRDIEEYREYFMLEKVLDYLTELAIENGEK